MTPYPELNQVLTALVGGAQQVLGRNLVGAYLQGSFAIGDFSEYSDCDFMIVLEQDLTGAELSGLQALHKELHELPLPYWPKNIEGSYAPRKILRRFTVEPRDPPDEPRDENWGDPGMDGAPPRCYPFWYLDHGASRLVRSEQDNSDVVRWTLREKGVRLAGPAIQDLIDPVSPAALRSEVRRIMQVALGTGLSMPMVAWQAFWIGLFCRIMHTLETGEVTSKRAAMNWALEVLDPQWHPLIREAQTQKKGDPTQAAAPVGSQKQQATRDFAAYCQQRVRHASR